MAELGPIGFAGGLNTKAGAFTLGKDQMTQAQNVGVVYGKLVKINGSAVLNPVALNSGAIVTGLADWQTVAQSRYLVTVCGNKIYQALNFAATPTDITGAATIVAGNLHTFDSLNNILAICGGTDTPLQWTGTGNVASLAGSPPVTSLVCTANNFMFLSGNATNPSRVYWSNVGDPNTWTAANFADFRRSDGDIVTAIASLAYNLVIFKRLSTGVLYTQTNSSSGVATLGPLTQVNVGIGCAGPLCWDTLPDGRLIVLGWDAHLRIFDGTNFIDVSDQPSPASNIQPTLDGLNFGLISQACVRVYPTLNQVWIACATAANTTNDSIFIYDYQMNVWLGTIPDRPANVLCASIDSRSVPHHPIVMVSGDYGGFTYEHDFGTTNAQGSGGDYLGSATTCTALGTESTDFIPRSVRVACDGQTTGQLQVGWGFNDLTAINETQTVLDMVLGGDLDTNFFLDTTTIAGSSLIIKTVPLPNTGRTYTVQIQFGNANAGQPFTVHPFFLSEGIIA